MGAAGSSTRKGKKRSARGVARPKPIPGPNFAAALKEALDQQAATAEILSLIAASPSDTRPVFEAIARSAQKLLGAHYANVARLVDDELHLAAHTGASPTADELLRKLFPAKVVGQGALGRAVLSKEAVCVADVETDPAYSPSFREGARQRGYRSLLAVPMVRDGAAIGTIAVTRREPGTFTDHQIRLLKTFADQAVIAIENVRLFNETKEALGQQTATAEILKVIASSPTDVQPVFDVIVERAVRLCGARFGRVYRYDGSTIQLVASHGLSASGLGQVQSVFPRPATDDTIVGRVILARRAYYMEDIERDRSVPALSRQMIQALGTRSQVTIPMLRAGQPIGAITLGWDKPGAFDDQQVALLQTFADQAVIAIENVRLFNETKEALEQQTATAEILKVISASPTDVRPVLQAIVERAAQLVLPCNVGLSMLEGSEIYQRASAGPQVTAVNRAELQKLFPIPLDPDASLLARSVARCEVVEVADTEASGLPPRVAAAGRIANYRSVTFIPLVREQTGIGALGVAHREAGFRLSEKQLSVLKTFADQAVIAIENVRLFNETREALEQQTATAEILRVISSSPSDMQPVFDSILEHAMRLCDAGLGTIGLYDGKTYTHRAQRGGSPEYVKKLFDEPFAPRPDGTVGRMIAERRPVHIPDYRELPAYRAREPRAVATVELGGARTYLAVPMLKDDRVLGGITIRRADVRPFTQKQIDLLSTFANQAVIAIENVRLFNETKEALEQQTAISEVLSVISASPTDVKPVLEAVAERAAKICDASDARIFLVEGDRMRHAAGSGDVPVWTESVILNRGSATGRAIVDLKPVQIADIEAQAAEYPVARENALKSGWRTVLAVPLTRERRALGAITLRRKEVRPFAEKQTGLLRTFADQAAIAIENVRLFNETREALEQQKASADVLAVISSSIADTKPVFDKILDSCERLFAGRNVGINIVGDDGRVHIGAYHGHGREELEAHFPVPLTMESGSGAAILQRQVVHYPDCEASDVPEYARRGGKIAGNKSVLFAPMMWEGRAVGAIFVGRPVAGPFSEKEIALLKTFADQAAIAIQNARLFREIQEKSAQLEVANKHKSEFLANMSHELRTPLNAIIGFSEALMERMFGEVNEKQADYLKDIHDSGRHLLSLINDILDLSKIEAGRMELDVSTFHLPTALSNAMTLIRERAQRHAIELALEVDERLGEFDADERKFKQIMLNLLSNAVKFTPDGGRVDVSARKFDGQVEVAVRDTGIGIAPEDQAAVFEEFKQVGRDRLSKAEGTGLGLALTKRFVELHGGAIRLESTPGKGSVFTVTLPLPSIGTC